MAPIPDELRLNDAELDEMMTSSWNMRIATIGPNGINLTPLWFGWAGGKIYSFCRGQKVVNLRRDPRCTILVDRNERFPELQGAMFSGTATVLEDADAEAADPHLAEVRVQMGKKYDGGHGEPATGEPYAATAGGKSWRWVVLEPDRTVSWDNKKIKRRG